MKLNIYGNKSLVAMTILYSSAIAFTGLVLKDILLFQAVFASMTTMYFFYCGYYVGNQNMECDNVWQ